MEVFVKMLGLSSPLLNFELMFTKWAQITLSPGQPLWFFISDTFSASQLLDFFVPLVGIFDYQLLVRLVCSLGVVNMATSLIKWTSPEHRPYWWARENYSGNNNNNFTKIHIEQFPLTCETSAGFPSSHTMAFTAFIYLCSRSFSKWYFRNSNYDQESINDISYVIVSISSGLMLFSRLYLGTQFVHQSVIAFFFAVIILKNMRKYSNVLLAVGKPMAIAFSLYMALVPALVYGYMNLVDTDPHWSVRMAFKWCIDPSYLRHETSPVFVIARDAGYLLGISVCTPLKKKYEKQSSFKKRLSTILVIEFFNHLARFSTPKDNGRFVFVAYEALRNFLHSFALLGIVPKIT